MIIFAPLVLFSKKKNCHSVLYSPRWRLFQSYKKKLRTVSVGDIVISEVINVVSILGNSL